MVTTCSVGRPNPRSDHGRITLDRHERHDVHNSDGLSVTPAPSPRREAPSAKSRDGFDADPIPATSPDDADARVPHRKRPSEGRLPHPSKACRPSILASRASALRTRSKSN
jgi:hypothetical protein